MKRDHTYSMRMSKRMREALQDVAREKRCSVAALIEEIISGYLAREEPSDGLSFAGERRGDPRRKITLPCRANSLRGSKVKEFPSVILNISETGALITFPKGSQVFDLTLNELSSFNICFEVPSTNECVRFECLTRHIRDAGAEIHLGATFKEAGKSGMPKVTEYLMNIIS
jgi:predicted DNA-binding protein